MRPDMHVSQADMRATVKLRCTNGVPVLFAMTDVLGLDTDVALASLFHVSTKTISRIRDAVDAYERGDNPDVQIGEKFMANTVTALGRYESTLARYGFRPTLDELFEVVPVLARAA